MSNDKKEAAIEVTIKAQPIKVIVNLDGKEIGYSTDYNEKGIASGTEVQEQSEDNLNQLKQGKKTINMIRVKNGLAPLKHCDVETISMDHIQELVTGRKQGMSLRDSLMRSVKEVKETNDFNEVNKLVKQSWILLGVALNNGEYIFSLGRVEINQEAAPEVPVQEQPSVRNELSGLEKQEIVHQVLQVFKSNNLSIKQCKDMLSEVDNALDNCRPWKF